MIIGLQTRLTLGLMGLVTTTLLLTGYLLMANTQWRDDEIVEHNLGKLCNVLVNGATEALTRHDEAMLHYWVRAVNPDEKSIYAAYLDGAGRVVAQSGMRPDEAGAAGDPGSAVVPELVHKITLPVKIGEQSRGRVVMGYLPDAASSLDREYVVTVIGVMILSLIMITVGSLYLTRKLINPIKYLTGVVSNVSYDRHIGLEKHILKRNDEVGVLARTFSEMAVRLIESYHKASDRNKELEERMEDRAHRLIKTNHELQAAQQRIHAIVENIADGVITTDAEDSIISCNCAAEQIFEYPQEQLLGRTFHSLLNCPGSDSDRLVSGTGAHEFKAFRKSGDCFSLEVALNSIYIESACTHIYVIRDISEHKSQLENLSHLADHDIDTGLYNKHHFEQEIEHVVERVRRGAMEPCAVIFLDLYTFPEIEHKYGKDISAQVLADIASLLQSRTRKSDELCHLNGDEFVLMAFGVTTRQAESVAGDFMRAVTGYQLEYRDEVITLKCAIGVAMITRATASAEQVLTFADYACYKARKAGTNRIQVFQYNVADSSAMPTPVSDKAG